MQLHHVVAMAMAAATTSATALNATPKNTLNGWYPCSGYTFSDEGSSTGQAAECAVYNAPLCYPGICETPEGVNPKVDIFMKRFAATKGNPENASNLWLLQGGPGYSSTSLEQDIMTLHEQLGGSVNIYTMDHRGTGQSTFLDCVAAQVTTTGSPWKKDIKPSEVAACAHDLQTKYGDLASFSVTTVTDVATFISTYTNGANTTVYGVSYGTTWVERLMHLAPPEVTGYALDGIATTSGASADKFFSISQANADFGVMGDVFLVLCEDSDECKGHFEATSLNSTLQGVLNQFDNDPNSTCAIVVKNGKKDYNMDDPPSFTLRRTLGRLLQMRTCERSLPLSFTASIVVNPRMSTL